MRRLRRAALVTVTVGLLVAAGLAVAMAVVPGFGPRSLVTPVIDALGIVTCDDDRCPPDAGWVRPVEAPVSSAFRSAARPDHHGVDLAAARGTPVVAASAGVVATAECQARRNGQRYGCDRDGSAEVLGCGWYVKVLHAHGRATLYCHLDRPPEVEVGDVVSTGQLLGYVGSTGNSSEPHLHFEVQQGGGWLTRTDSADAIDPVPFLADQGAPLS